MLINNNKFEKNKQFKLFVKISVVQLIITILHFKQQCIQYFI